MPGIFYQLEKRSNALMRVIELTNRTQREKELKEFITEEKAILIGMAPPCSRSKALDTANLMLKTLQMENSLIVNPIPKLNSKSHAP